MSFGGKHDCGRMGVRPIHPECDLFGDPGSECTCAVRWDYWDGAEGDLLARIELAERRERRTRVGVHSLRGLGAGPDDLFLEATSYPDIGAESEAAALETGELEASGFWKESEFLKQ